MRSPIPDERLDRIEVGARQSVAWPAQAGSRWVRERSDDILALVAEIRALRTDLAHERAAVTRLGVYVADLEGALTDARASLADLLKEADR